MAISALTWWEIRPGVGSDTNGGGFVQGASGTDYSQTDAKRTSGSNVSVTDLVGNGTTTVTSATAAFTSAIVGNIVYITGTGLTTGWYEVKTYTNATTVVLDRNPGTGTGGTLNIGGALATVSAAYGASNNCNTFWIKNTGSYTVTALLDLTKTNGNTSSGGGPMRFIGYGTTRGDATKATWTTATNSTKLVTFHAGGGYVFRNITFTNTASVRDSGLFIGNNYGITSNVVIENCVFDGFTRAIDCQDYTNNNVIAQLTVRNTEIKNCTVNGVENGGGVFTDCYIHSNTNMGMVLTGAGSSTPTILNRCVIYNNGQYGVNWNGNRTAVFVVILNCAFVSNSQHGIKQSQGTNPSVCWLIQNSIFYGNGWYGISTAEALGGSGQYTCFIGINNAFGANSSGNYEGDFSWGGSVTGDITLTADPFTSKSTGDFSLNNTAGGGAALKAAGYQTSLY